MSKTAYMRGLQVCYTTCIKSQACRFGSDHLRNLASYWACLVCASPGVHLRHKSLSEQRARAASRGKGAR